MDNSRKGRFIIGEESLGFIREQEDYPGNDGYLKSIKERINK